MDSIPAIYEDGVFKPTGPVSLPERTEVRIPLPEAEPAPLTDEQSEQRRAAWKKLFAEIDADPDLRRESDGFSGADHDRILYGGPNGPA